MPLPSHRSGSNPPPVASQSAVTRRRAEDVASASTSFESVLLFFLVLIMIAALLAAFHGLHKIAHMIVTEFGVPGGVIACGVIYAISLIMDRAAQTNTSL